MPGEIEFDEVHAQAFNQLEQFIFRIFTSAESEALTNLLALDISFSQARTIFILAGTGRPLAIGEIAEAVKLSLPAAGRTIDQLVELGLVLRTESEEDRRVKLASLTDQGRELAASHLDSKRDAVRRIIQTLDSPQCQRLIDALEPLTG